MLKKLPVIGSGSNKKIRPVHPLADFLLSNGVLFVVANSAVSAATIMVMFLYASG
jgi:hypothetical protein